MRNLILFKNGLEVTTFNRTGPMHKYVNERRLEDRNGRWWVLEDGKLTYHYRTQKEIEDEQELKDRIAELEEERAGPSL